MPGTAGSATHFTVPLLRMRGTLCFGPPPNVARGASKGGRLGGRPHRHHQEKLPITFKEPGASEKRGQAIVRPKPVINGEMTNFKPRRYEVTGESYASSGLGTDWEIRELSMYG